MVQALLDTVRASARAGDIDDATAVINTDLLPLGPDDRQRAQAWNLVCWQGTLAGKAEMVGCACDHAVALAPDDGGFRDSRGITRTITGHFLEAIEDFRAFVTWVPSHGQGNLLKRPGSHTLSVNPQI